jgi:glucose/arabinose dehydrogenase/mono/diheme cytochrome c family protein
VNGLARTLFALSALTAAIAVAAPVAGPPSSGIETRIPFTASRLAGSPDPPLPYQAKRAFPKLNFKHPLYITHLPGSERMLVVEQSERILAFTNHPDVTSTEKFCFLRDHEIYSVTFHPAYASNRFAYVFSNGPQSSQHKTNKIFRYVIDRESLTCDDASRQVIIEWESNGHNGGDLAFGPDGMLYISSGDGTSDSDRNVTGQDITDLNSGILRIDVETPAGEVRDSSLQRAAYSIPKDNPFLNIPDARGELWCYGLRNPWRIQFDPAGRLWIGDIGQDLWEMIIVAQRGANYGWSVTEGGHSFRLQRARGPTPIVAPTIEHSHSEARSITGGIIYRGSKLPRLRGAYVYADYGTGRIWGARYANGRIEWNELIADTSHEMLGFGEDAHGEMFYTDYVGAIYELEPSPPATTTNRFPRKLSETGLFASVREHRLQPGIIPYSVNAPGWSDGAHAERFIMLPGDSQIEFNEREAWKFPEGAVLVQSLALDLAGARTAESARTKAVADGSSQSPVQARADSAIGASQRKWIETRVLLFEENEWAGYSYQWNDEQTDAVLLAASGDEREFAVKDPRLPGGARNQTWHYPSRSECLTCHSRQAGFVLGLSTWQINREHVSHGIITNQLSTLAHIGALKVNLHDHVAQLQARIKSAMGNEAMRFDIDKPLAEALAPFTNIAGHQFTNRLAQVPRDDFQHWWTNLVKNLRNQPQFTTMLARTASEYPRLANPYDTSAGLTNRVRAYLHANCSHCHTEAGGGNSAMELTAKTKLEDMRLIDAPPQHDTFELREARLISPGHPERSVMFWRLTHRGFGQMPPLAVTTVDDEAVRLFEAWIHGVGATSP